MSIRIQEDLKFNLDRLEELGIALHSSNLEVSSI